MVTQKLTIRLDESELPEIRMVSGDIGREIQIEVYAREDSDTPIDLETYSAEITIIKPDNTFIMDNFTVDKYELPEQAGAVSGSGYYQIKIFTAGLHQIYTGHGRFLVDDMILSDDVIESSSIAFGDRFPEDFATKTWVDDEIEAHGIGTYVAGNPAGEETMPPLVRLQINDDIYPLIHKVEEQEDADITDPAEGDVLTYDADDQKWKNEPLVIPDPTVTKTATGNPIEFSDGAAAPLVKCITQIQGYQSGTGTPSPDNIRPIVAYTEGEIEVSGRNLTDVVSITTLPNTGNIRNTNGTIYTGFVKNKTYTVSFDLIVAQKSSTAEGNRLGLWLNDSGTSLWRPPITAIGHQSFTFTAEADGYVNFWCTGAFDAETKVIDNIQIEEGSIEHDYEPYTSTTHTTTYPSAIYRGSEDCVKGEVTGDRVYTKGFTRGSIDSSGKLYNIGILTGIEYIGSYTIADMITSHFDVKTLEQARATTEKCICVYGTTAYVGGYVGDEATLDALLPNLEIAYKLAAPTTSSVTPTNLPIKSLSGYTHIESTTGEMEVEYITQQWDAIMTAAQLDNIKVYSTAEQVVGKWVDGSDVYESVIITEFNNATPQYTVDLSNIGGVSTMPVFVSHSVLEAMEGTTPIKQIIMPAASNSGYSSIAVNHQSNAVTGKAYLTVRYIKL